jgi:glycosyltransferase involved in cell wall biosynthesis
MAKFVVFGLGPMRWESSTRLFALGLRTWHFAHTLAREGHEVVLFAMRGLAYEGWPADKITHVTRGRVSVFSISEHLCHERPDWIARRIRELGPDAVIGVNRDPAAIAVNFAGDLPLWADINGDPMAEAQVKASALGADWNINDWYRKFAPVLHRADRFSTCSRAQRAALIGQLGMIGRMTAKNDGYEFVSAIPNSIDDEELASLGRIERPLRKPNDNFVLLWSGGYNTWTDPDVLFEALELAMRAAPQLSFVSTGGGIPGHHVDAYEHFRQRVASSSQRERFELAGWVQTAELPAYYAGAHAAILVDRFSYEGVLGARTRMLDWLAAGLPIVSTRLSEISEELDAAQIAISAPCGDATAIKNAILSLYEDPHEAYERGERGRVYAREHLRAQIQLAPLLAWAQDPRRAPDGEHHIAMRWRPGASVTLLQHANLVRTALRERGVRDTALQVGRFALRRLRNGAEGAAERLGFSELQVSPLEAPVPEAKPIDPPRLAPFEWRARFAALEKRPSVSLLVLVDRDTPAHVVRWTCDQVRTQYIDGWNAVLAHSGPLSAEVEAELSAQAQALQRSGQRVERVDLRSTDLAKHHLLVKAQWVLLLASGSLLRPDALAEFCWAAREKRADIVYAHERHVDETNVVMPPQPKPGWCPELFLARPYLGRTVLIRSSRLELSRERAAEWPPEALIYDALLRATDRACRVQRIPHVLAHLWTPQASPEAEIVRREQRIAVAQREAVCDALWRRGSNADVERGARPGSLRIRWPIPDDPVTVIVLGSGLPSVVERCRASIERHSKLATAKVVVAKAGRAGNARIGCLIGSGRFAVIVDPHLEAFHSDWLGALIEQAARSRVGAVSPKLLAPNGATAWQPGHGDAPSWAADAVQETTELSPLCIAGPRGRFEDLEVPFDETKRGSWLASVVADWKRSGHRTLYTPFSFVYAHPHNGAVHLEVVRSQPSADKAMRKRRLRKTSSL